MNCDQIKYFWVEQIHTLHSCIVSMYEMWYKIVWMLWWPVSFSHVCFMSNMCMEKAEACRKAGKRKIEDTNLSPLPSAVADKLGMSGFH